MGKQYYWHKIAESVNEIEFNENRIAIADINGKKICIAQSGESLFGFAYKCPHAGGILSDGYIDAAGNVVCPIHRYKFCLTNGRNTSGEGFYLKTYPIELRSDGVFLGVQSSGFFATDCTD